MNDPLHLMDLYVAVDVYFRYPKIVYVLYNYYIRQRNSYFESSYKSSQMTRKETIVS